MTYSVEQPQAFAHWHDSLRDMRDMRDMRARIAIARRIERTAAGNLGDVGSLGEGLRELRIDVAAGYRVYFIQRGEVIIVLLAGGDKSSQRRDIHTARQLAHEVRT